MGSRIEYWNDPQAPAPNSLVPAAGVLAVDGDGRLLVFSDPGHIVAYGDGEIRQEYEVIFLAIPLSGEPHSNDEASDVRWVTVDVDDPDAPAPNSLVVATSAVVVNSEGCILMQRRADLGTGHSLEARWSLASR